MNKILLTLTGIFFFIKLSSQAPLGTWTSYLPYNKAQSLAIQDQKIFCSTSGGMFYFNTGDNSIQKFSKEDGLSDFEISALGYSKEVGILIIAYANANLDLVDGKEIYNISDIERKQILGDKKIYAIHFIGNDAFLACGFGIVKLDLEKREIRETYLIGDQGTQVKVNGLTHLGTDLYAATEQGLFRASLDAPNLIDFNNWHKINELPEGGFSFSSITATQNKVFVNLVNSTADQDIIYSYDGISWQVFQDFGSSLVTHLSSNGQNLVICEGKYVQIIRRIRKS